MDKNEKQFSDKFNLLPEEAQYYLSNEFSGKIILNLAKDYHINSDYVYDLVFDTVNCDFDFNYIRTEIAALNLKEVRTDVFFKDFIGQFFLPLSSYIKNVDIKNVLIKNGGDPKLYQENVDKFLALIEDENLNNLDNLITVYKKIVDPKEEKEYVLNLFRFNLLEVLNSESPEATASLNGGLIFLLNNDADASFKKNLEETLYTNKEKISANKISLDNREVEATVANYLRDFIKTNGSEFFSGVVLAQYLSSSANLKKLNQKEKYLVGQLLKLYRNLSFLPDSMGSLAVENWQIIPFDQVIINKSSVKNKPSKPEVSKKINSPSVAKEDLLNTSAELRELEKEILDYPENSLEYRALKEEMKRFSGAKKK